jgi:hypothetical protein
MEEESKAIQAIAKTTEKGIDAATKVGGFLAKFLSGSLEQGIGIFEDKLKYLRWERQVRLMKRAEELLKEQGLGQPTRPVPLKLAIPLIQEGSLEEDNDLQDIWAKLLVNAGDARNNFQIRSAFISILKDLSSLDAIILHKIFSVPGTDLQKEIFTLNLPQNALLEIPEEKEKLLPTEDVQISLSNLARLELLKMPITFGGFPSPRKVHRTQFGKEFFKACTLKNTEIL